MKRTLIVAPILLVITLLVVLCSKETVFYFTQTGKSIVNKELAMYSKQLLTKNDSVFLLSCKRLIGENDWKETSQQHIVRKDDTTFIITIIYDNKKAKTGASKRFIIKY